MKATRSLTPLSPSQRTHSAILPFRPKRRTAVEHTDRYSAIDLSSTTNPGMSRGQSNGVQREDGERSTHQRVGIRRVAGAPLAQGRPWGRTLGAHAQHKSSDPICTPPRGMMHHRSTTARNNPTKRKRKNATGPFGLHRGHQRQVTLPGNAFKVICRRVAGKLRKSRKTVGSRHAIVFTVAPL